MTIIFSLIKWKPQKELLWHLGTHKDEISHLGPHLYKEKKHGAQWMVSSTCWKRSLTIASQNNCPTQGAIMI
jgi:hypothetical protein